MVKRRSFTACGRYGSGDFAAKLERDLLSDATLQAPATLDGPITLARLLEWSDSRESQCPTLLRKGPMTVKTRSLPALPSEDSTLDCSFETLEVSTIASFPSSMHMEDCRPLIIWDWDDTLFPTTWVRNDLSLDPKLKLDEQKGFPQAMMFVVKERLKKCAEHVTNILRASVKYGRVAIVTLAKDRWVAESCENFLPEVGALLEELKIELIYADTGCKLEEIPKQIAAAKQFFGKMKAKAITTSLLEDTGSEPLRNILSIGDSEIERTATLQAAEEYLQRLGGGDAETPAGCQQRPEAPKVFVKTFKLIEQPTIEEFQGQMKLLEDWFPRMVELEESFDLQLDELHNPREVEAISEALRGKTSTLTLKA